MCEGSLVEQTLPSNFSPCCAGGPVRFGRGNGGRRTLERDTKSEVVLIALLSGYLQSAGLDLRLVSDGPLVGQCVRKHEQAPA